MKKIILFPMLLLTLCTFSLAQGAGRPRQKSTSGGKPVHYQPRVDGRAGGHKELESHVPNSPTPTGEKQAVGVVSIHAFPDMNVDRRAVLVSRPGIADTHSPPLDPSTPAQTDKSVGLFTPPDDAASISINGLAATVDQQQAAAAVPTPTPRSEAKAEPPAPSNQDAAANEPKKPKRGSLIFAPIPISSPAVGSGLVLGVGYVFKFKQEDKLSPPSTVGLVGAFTNSGTRGGGVGGRLYFNENKYQTTFVFVKGRVNFDFYGIGRVPGRDSIKVPLKAGGTVFFGEFLRNVWKDVFVGPRFQ